jgi:MinD superfamily P-loop ATPase
LGEEVLAGIGTGAEFRTGNMLKIAVGSGKGGTGKTFIATNLFYTLSKNNYRTSLTDCDAEAPNALAFFNKELINNSRVTKMVPVINRTICTYCGKCHEYCNFNAIFILPPAGIINVIEDLCHGCGACSVACNFNAITEKPVSLGQITKYSTNNDRLLTEARTDIGAISPVQVIKAALKDVDSKTDIAILDSPPGTSCPFIQTVAVADYVVLVTEPTPFGLSDLKQSVEALRIINKPFGVIINRAGLGYKEVHSYLNTQNIPLLMEVPFKKEIAALYARGKLVAETDYFFEKQMLAVFDLILIQYGNRNYKR